MTAFWTYVNVEWKLMLRSASFVFLLGAVLISVLIALIDNPYTGDIGRYASESAYRFMWYVLVLAQFWAVMAARRDATSKADLLLAAMPYRSGQLLAAKLTALIVPFGAIALVPAVCYACASWMAGITVTSMAPGIAMLASMTIPTTLTIVLGYWIGTRARRRLAYLYGFGIVLLLLLFAKAFFQNMVPFSWTHLLEYGLIDFPKTGFYSELWGFTGDATYWMHRLVYASLTVLLFGTFVYRTKVRRKERVRKRVYYPLFAAAAASMVLGISVNASVWKARAESHESVVAFDQGLARQTSDQRYAALKPLRYDLKLRILEKHRMEVRGTMRLSHEGREPFARFPLSLRHRFQIDELTVNGSAASFEWEPGRDVVWIVPARPVQPGTSADISIGYGGAVDDWSWHGPQQSKGMDDLLGVHWERRAFIDIDRLFLPGYYGWYPYPGTGMVESGEPEQSHFTGDVKEAARENRPLRQPAEFRVEVETSARMKLFANGERAEARGADGKRRIVFEASGARAFNLIGGDIAEWMVSNGGKELSVLLSGQVPPAKAKRIADKMLEHYTALSEMAGLMNPEAYYPDSVRLVRTDYPDMALSELLNIRLLSDVPIKERPLEPIDKNGFVYLPDSIRPASMILDKLTHFDQYLLAETVLAPNAASDSWLRIYPYMKDAVTQSIEHRGSSRDGPLFRPERYKLNGEPHPVYMAMNGVYERMGKPDFPKAIVAMYEFARHYKGGDARTDADFTAFLNGLAGARP